VQAQVKQLAAAGLDIAWHEYPKAHTMIEEEFRVILDFVARTLP
jgi:predicted esterase